MSVEHFKLIANDLFDGILHTYRLFAERVACTLCHMSLKHSNLNCTGGACCARGARFTREAAYRMLRDVQTIVAEL